MDALQHRSTGLDQEAKTRQPALVLDYHMGPFGGRRSPGRSMFPIGSCALGKENLIY